MESTKDFTALDAACALLGLRPAYNNGGVYEHPQFYSEVDLSDLAPDMETLPRVIIERLFAKLDICQDEKSELNNHMYD